VTPGELALEDVLLAVQASHPLLAAAEARVDGAQADRLAAAGALDPVVAGKSASKLGEWTTADVGVKAPLTVWGGDVSAGWALGEGQFEPYEGDLRTGPGGEIYAAVDLPVLRDAWTDRRRANVARARREADVATAERDQRELELLRAAGHRYWDWVAAGQRLTVAEDLLALAETRDRAFAAQVELGDIAPIVRQDSRRLVLERTERVVQARRTFEQAAIELSLHLRDTSGRRVLVSAEALPHEIVAVPAREEVAAAVSLALEQRPELDRLDAQLAQADVEERLAANQALPAVDLLGELATPAGSGGYDEWKVGVAADWPVPARTARGRLGSARAWEDRLRAERAFAEDRIAADVEDAASALEAARARVGLAEELVETARIVAEAERRRLELGDSNLIFVNQREIAQAEAEQLLIDARAAAQKAWVDWRWAQGELD
jgi:cobalt-zinc-cadmium efflux system outer membrane protein